jgi:ureidoglycolate lyase
MSDRTLTMQDPRTKALEAYADLGDNTGVDPAFDSEVFSFWNDLSVGDVSGASVSFGLVRTKPGDMKAPMLERHINTTETLVPLDEDIVLVLAEPSPAETPDLDTLAAFRIPRGTPVTLRKGTWHYVPLIPGKKEGRTLVVFRQGTPGDDLQVHEVLEKDGVSITVRS